MNLQNATEENMTIIVNEIKSNLKIVNTSIIRPENFQLSDYNQLYDIFQMIDKKKGRLTMMEIEGILEELGKIKKG